MANKFVDKNGLLYFWQKIVNKFVAKETGKGLSTNDFTNELKTKLDGVAEGANKTTVEDNLMSTSTTNALSANQGRILDGKIKDINDSLSDLGGGDMLKSVYDSDGNGKVDNADNADNLDGQPSSYYAKASDILNKFSELTNDGAVQYTTQTLTDDQKAQARANIGAGTSNFDGDYEKLTNKPTNFAPATHTHEMSDVNGLSDALAGKSDDTHKHTTSDITDFQTEMDKKANTSHTHQQSEITGLESVISDVTEIAQGKCNCYTYDTVADMNNALENTDFVATLKTGDVFLIRALDVPDYWWDGDSGTTQPLETTKVTLEVITNAEIDSIVSAS